MDQDTILSIIDRHFEFETPELVDRVVETYADEVIWEAPARNIILTDHDEIVANYRQLVACILEPKMEVLHRFAVGDEAFDDRIVYFTVGENNPWKIAAGASVKLRLVHYFKLKGDKICHEIGYEMWQVLD